MRIYTILFAIFFSSLLLSQEVPESIISDLTPEQLSQIEELQEDQIETEELDPEIPQSTLNEDAPIENFFFGFDFVRTTPTTISATTDLPVPNDYIVTFNDVLKINLTGTKRTIFNQQVTLDGTIQFPEIGPISVAGETFKDVKDKLKRLIDNSYVGVEIDVSLAELSAKKITIIGAVDKPGVYLVNPFTTISNSLAYAGGISEYASLRTIKIIKPWGETYNFDLYDLLIKGKRDNDITIGAGDTIIVGSTTNFVSIEGSVKREQVYEYLKGETVKDFIDFALGFTGDANTKNIALTTSKKQVLNTENYEYPEDRSLDGVTKIQVFSKTSKQNLDIRVFGPLNNSGFFRYELYPNLKALIKDLDFGDNVYPFLGLVENVSDDESVKESHLFSLLDESTHNINLKPNSKVFLFSNEEIGIYNASGDKSFIDFDISKRSNEKIRDYSLMIQFKNEEINFPIYGKYSPIDLIRFLNLDKDIIQTEQVSYVAPLANKKYEGNIYDMALDSERNAILSFRNIASELIKVSVRGEVVLAGDYFISSETTLAELYAQIGGLKESADRDIAILSRVSVREKQLYSLDLAKQQLKEFLLANSTRNNSTISPAFMELIDADFSEQSLGRIAGDFSIDSAITKEFTFEEGDTFTIPRKVNTVFIIGEVLNPSTMLFDKSLSLKRYIENAGGFKQFALKDGVYVIRGDGTIVKARQNFFVRSVKIYPGDTIVVPRDLRIPDQWLERLGPISQFIFNSAFAATAIDNLRNND